MPLWATRNYENRSLTEITEHTEEFNRLLLFTVSTVSSVRDPFKLNF